MDNKNINAPRRVKLEIDPAMLPETFAFFREHETEEMPVMKLAAGLLGCDKGAAMPRELFDFIVDLYQEAIASGDAVAMNDLGALYYDGHGCEQDFAKAFHYYEMAAARGCSVAQENLGYCYYYGRNVPVDDEKAFRYFALGAFTGHISSLYKIGDMYLNGRFVAKDPVEAFRIYDRCLNMMTDEAAPLTAGPVYLRLGDCLLNGIGTASDPKTALFCYQRAEQFLYDMVMNGELWYKKSLESAVEGQAKAREAALRALPDRPWPGSENA
ncbi:MAG: sel1 repeat family protein [Clostridia bacterium]|nr:sel1 repeat family protein [Clostridia bacterium]